MEQTESKSSVESWLDKWGTNLDWEAKKELRKVIASLEAKNDRCPSGVGLPNLIQKEDLRNESCSKGVSEFHSPVA